MSKNNGKTFDERKKDLLQGVGDGRYITEAEADFEVFRDLADRRDNEVGSVMVSTDLLVDWARRVREQSGGTAEITVSEDLPVVADVGGEQEICLAPRVRT